MDPVPNHENHVKLVGGVIKRAISEYQSKSFKKNQSKEWEEARAFIFDKPRLENFLEKYCLDGILNCDYLRHEAKHNKLVEAD